MTEAGIRELFTGTWIGDLRGTVIGNLYVEFKDDNGQSLTHNVSDGYQGFAIRLAMS
jgi:hypothetical protein